MHSTKKHYYKLKYASNTYHMECSEHAPQQLRKMHPPALNLNSFLRDPESAFHKLQLDILSVIQLFQPGGELDHPLVQAHYFSTAQM